MADAREELLERIARALHDATCKCEEYAPSHERYYAEVVEEALLANRELCLQVLGAEQVGWWDKDADDVGYRCLSCMGTGKKP